MKKEEMMLMCTEDLMNYCSSCHFRYLKLSEQYQHAVELHAEVFKQNRLFKEKCKVKSDFYRAIHELRQRGINTSINHEIKPKSE